MLFGSSQDAPLNGFQFFPQPTSLGRASNQQQQRRWLSFSMFYVHLLPPIYRPSNQPTYVLFTQAVWPDLAKFHHFGNFETWVPDRKCNLTINRKIEIDIWSAHIEIYYPSSEHTCLNIQNVWFFVKKSFWVLHFIKNSKNRRSAYSDALS